MGEGVSKGRKTNRRRKNMMNRSQGIVGRETVRKQKTRKAGREEKQAKKKQKRETKKNKKEEEK